MYSNCDSKWLARKAWSLLKASIICSEEIGSFNTSKTNNAYTTNTWQCWGPLNCEEMSFQNDMNNNNNNNNNNKSTSSSSSSSTVHTSNSSNDDDDDDNCTLGAELNTLSFSFYLAANLPVSDYDRLALLHAEDVVSRLR